MTLTPTQPPQAARSRSPCSAPCWPRSRRSTARDVPRRVRRRRGRRARPAATRVLDAQRAVRADPDSAAAYAGLGEAYLQRARETGDPSLLLARRPRLRRGAPPRPARARRADRRRDARRAPARLPRAAAARHARRMRLAPGLARPLTVVADAQVELGRYGAAARSIQRLVDLSPGSPPTRAPRISASWAATRRARSRRCAWPSPRAAARPRTRLRPGAARRPRARSRPAGGGARRLSRRAALAARAPARRWSGSRGCDAAQRRPAPGASPGCAGPRGCCR